MKTVQLNQRVAHSTLTPEHVLMIRASAESNRKLAERYGVSPRTIRGIKRGKTWRWLDAAIRKMKEGKW